MLSASGSAIVGGMQERRAFRVYSEENPSRTLYGVTAFSEKGALLSISWGYSSPTFSEDDQGRAQAISYGEVFRAEELPLTGRTKSLLASVVVS